MSKKLTSKLIQGSDYGAFWDHHGSQYHAELGRVAEQLGTGLHYDVYTDEMVIRLDGSLKPGEQRIIEHNFTKDEASPAYWKQL